MALRPAPRSSLSSPLEAEHRTETPDVLRQKLNDASAESLPSGQMKIYLKRTPLGNSEPNRMPVSEEINRLRSRVDEANSRSISDRRTVVRAETQGPVEVLMYGNLWCPPRLLDLPHPDQFSSVWTWTGEIERFELVKSLRRCVNRRGQALSDDELELAVLLYERTEALMQQEQFDEARECLTLILNTAPNSTLAYFKLGLLALLPATTDGGVGGGGRTKRMGAGAGIGGGGDDDSDAVEIVEEDEEEEAAPAARSGKEGGGEDERALLARVELARPFLRRAASLEAENTILVKNIDLLLRMVSGVEIPEEYWTAQVPRSTGDIAAMVALASCSQSGIPM